MADRDDLMALPPADVGSFAASGMPGDVPWPDEQSWQAANHALGALVVGYADCLAPCRLQAGVIQQDLLVIDRMMAPLCAATCPWCPDPCCLKATVWIDFPDLLYFYLTQTSVPLGQPKLNRGAVCRYLGPRGCRLPRYCRPWTCTRYICPTQKRWWWVAMPGQQAMFEARVSSVRRNRRALEATFIAIVSGNDVPAEEDPADIPR